MSGIGKLPCCGSFFTDAALTTFASRPIIHRDPVYLQQLLSAIQTFLADRLRLQLHPRKVEIRKFSHGIDFLGYVLLPHHRVLRTKTKQRMFKKLSRQQELLATNQIELERFHQSVQSYRGLVKHANGYELERLVQNMFPSDLRTTDDRRK